MTARVGFVGLGEMGLPMASRLVQAGFEVAGYDVRPERVERLGGRSATSAREAAEGADIVVLIPFDAAQLEEALLGQHGALESLAPGSLIVAMPTIGPRAMREIAARVSARGDYGFVDSPVTGGAARAASGELTAIVSGFAASIERAQPVLQAMCSRVFTVGGEPGMGQLTKLINQLLVGTHLAATAEAFALAAAGGVDPAQLYEVLTSGAARSEILVSRAAAVLDGSLKTGGAMAIFLKDLPLVLDLARELHVPLFTTSAAFNLVQLGTELGRSGEDDAALIAELMNLARRHSPPLP